MIDGVIFYFRMNWNIAREWLEREEDVKLTFRRTVCCLSRQKAVSDNTRAEIKL